MADGDIKIGWKVNGNMTTNTPTKPFSNTTRSRRRGGRRDTSKSTTAPRTPEQIANLPELFPSAPTSIHHPQPPPPPSSNKKGLPNVPPARYNMVLNQGKVKSVQSGDSITLTSIDNPDRERTLSLAYVAAPHLRKDGDEPWAFQSRDALRKLLVGKNVQFSVLYQIPNTKREYGIIYLPDGHILPEDMVKEGWLKLREDAGRKEDSDEALAQVEKLRQLETAARNEYKGLWGKEVGRINVEHDLGDSEEFLSKYKGKSVDGIVERVLSGDRMLLRLLISPDQHLQGMLDLQ